MNEQVHLKVKRVKNNAFTVYGTNTDFLLVKEFLLM